MTVAFATAALAAAFATAALAASLLWMASVVLSSPALWALAPVVIGLVALAFGVATYLAERVAYRRTLARMRSIGEPWAFREG